MLSLRGRATRTRHRIIIVTTDLDVVQLRIPEGVIALGVGQPDPSLLPLEVMRQAVASRVAEPDPLPWLAYGVEQGNGHFRVALAGMLSRHYRGVVDPRALFVTTGSSSALEYVCATFTQPGDTVLVEEPSYFLALGILADHGLRVVGVATDEDGLIPEALERAARTHRPRFLYTIPTFHNPCGTSLPEDRRASVVELSQRHDFLIVADEVYQLLSFDRAPPRPLAAWVESDTVLSLGSFSKILAPGLRLGWIQTGPGLMERLMSRVVLASGGGLNPFTESMVRSAIELGLQDLHLQRLRDEYRRRATALAHALRRHLPETFEFSDPQGGFFVWLRLPESIDADALLSEAREHGVTFKPGHLFSSAGRLRHHARLCFAYYEPTQLEEGVVRLARALR